MNLKNIAYWISLVLFSVAMGFGGVADLMKNPEIMNSLKQLGYPEYLAMILGFWKIAGVIAILLPRLGLLKEWAYAGFFFDLSGASLSHIMVQDDLAKVIIPIVILAIGDVPGCCDQSRAGLGCKNRQAFSKHSDHEQSHEDLSRQFSMLMEEQTMINRANKSNPCKYWRVSLLTMVGSMMMGIVQGCTAVPTNIAAPIPSQALSDMHHCIRTKDLCVINEVCYVPSSQTGVRLFRRNLDQGHPAQDVEKSKVVARAICDVLPTLQQPQPKSNVPSSLFKIEAAG